MKQEMILDNEALQKAAPSIFATKPFVGMSDHYKFIPTIDVVDQMRNNGFFPVMATQSKTRCQAKQDLTRHMIKFRQDKFIGEAAVVGQEVPEIVLVNSHDGSSLYELAMGIFRFICGNGMVVQSSDFGSYSIRHNGLVDDLIETTFKVVADFPKAFEQIAHMKTINLVPVKQLQLAEKALGIKYPDNDSSVPASLLLDAKREDDETVNGDRTLWNTFNVIQENLMKGGLEGKSIRTITQGANAVTVERKTKTKPIKAIQEDLRINKELWSLATQEYAIAA